MVDMKHPVLAAGNLLRRRLLHAGAAGAAGVLWGGLLSACTAPTRSSPSPAGIAGVLSPMRTLQGARLILRPSPTAVPIPHDGFGAMTQFAFPVAVAANSFDIFIADAGVQRLYRYDPLVEAMAVLPGVLVTPQTRLALGTDTSIYVSNPGSMPVRRYDRNGRQLQEIDPHLGAARYDEVAIDRINSTVYGLDRVFGRLEAVHPLGHSAILVHDELLSGSPTAIAWDERLLYLAGGHCGCVVAIDPEQGTRTVVAEGFRQPSAIAVRDGWLVVLDRIERKLTLFHHGQLRGEATAESLRLVDPQGIALGGGFLYVADAAGRRVAIFRLGR